MSAQTQGMARRRLLTSRATKIVLESLIALMTFSFGFFSMLFIKSGMAGPAAANAFFYGVLMVRMGVQVWRRVR